MPFMLSEVHMSISVSVSKCVCGCRSVNGCVLERKNRDNVCQ